MLITNPFLTTEGILEALAQCAPESRPYFPQKLVFVFFKKQTEYVSQAIIKAQEQTSSNEIDELMVKFKAFPRLQFTVKQILLTNASEDITIPEKLVDWSPDEDEFMRLNKQYRYFDEGKGADSDILKNCFIQLAVRCKMMVEVIEEQTYHPLLPYILMALFYDHRLKKDDNIKNISKCAEKLLKKGNHYYDLISVKLPVFHSEYTPSWKAFINKESFQALASFSQFGASQNAFENIGQANDAMLVLKYPKAGESRVLANLCRNLLITNEGFEEGLSQIRTGWPKKQTDHLPIIDLKVIAPKEAKDYFWVKLPPQDMRALYLGNLIPECCQFINGDSRDCVIDGITRADNGFYVLLKSKTSVMSKPRIDHDQINDKDYAIVAQSYAWLSLNGNLCLDSIEWHAGRIKQDLLKDSLIQFAQEIFRCSDIHHVTVGTGGQTPEEMFSPALVNETMRQGVDYGDSSHQLIVASRLTRNDFPEDLELYYSEEFIKTMLYLGPCFPTSEGLIDELIKISPDIETRIVVFQKHLVSLPDKLSVSDFRQMTFDEYQKMAPKEQTEVSLNCKIFNSSSIQHLIQWFPALEEKDLHCLAFKEYAQDLHQVDQKVMKTILAAMPQLLIRELIMSTILEADFSEFSYTETYQIIRRRTQPPILSVIITKMLEALPPRIFESIIEKCFELDIPFVPFLACSPSLLEIAFRVIPTDNHQDIIRATLSDKFSPALVVGLQHIESAEIMINHYPKASLPELLKEKVFFGGQCRSILEHMVPTESFSLIKDLALIKELALSSQNELLRSAIKRTQSFNDIMARLTVKEKLEALSLASTKYIPFLTCALKENKEVFEIALNMIPQEERCSKILCEGRLGKRSVIQESISIEGALPIILESLSESDQLKAIAHQTTKGFSLLYDAVGQAALIRILRCCPIEDRFDLLTKENSFAKTVIYLTVGSPKVLEAILDELLPSSQRQSILLHESSKGHSIIGYAQFHPTCIELKAVIDRVQPTQEMPIKRKGLNP